MFGDYHCLMAESNTINITFGKYLMMGIRNWHRIVVIVKSDQG